MLMGMTMKSKSVDEYPAQSDAVDHPVVRLSLWISAGDWLPHCEAVK